MEMRFYRDELTADVNNKGVLDIDTVKGCTSGMAARPGVGCYGECYAAKIAKFRGLDFGHSVVRKVYSVSQAKAIEHAVKNSPYGFFRIGTMGDPCHAWEETTQTVEWLSPYAVPVIVTKHWHRATDEQFKRLIHCGAILNTSVSALDTRAQLAHREHEMERYAALGGNSVARVVSCDFNEEDIVGARMALVQARLLRLRPIIDNPLRVSKSHPLAVSGVIRTTQLRDLNSVRTISLANPGTYLGHCKDCPDMCGLSSRRAVTTRPSPPQYPLYEVNA